MHFFVNHGLSSTLCKDLRRHIFSLLRWELLGRKGKAVVLRGRDVNPYLLPVRFPHSLAAALVSSCRRELVPWVKGQSPTLTADIPRTSPIHPLPTEISPPCKSEAHTRVLNSAFPIRPWFHPLLLGMGVPLRSAILSFLPEHLLLGPVLLGNPEWGDGWQIQRSLTESLEKQDKTFHLVDFSSEVEEVYPQSHLRSRGCLVFLPSLLFFCILSSCFSSLCSCCLCSPNCFCRTGHVSFFAFSYLLASGQATEATNSNQLFQPGSPPGAFLSPPSIPGASSAISDSILSSRVPLGPPGVLC